jgi:hypothetical protein
VRAARLHDQVVHVQRGARVLRAHTFQSTTARLQREAVERDEMLELMERNYGVGERVAA